MEINSLPSNQFADRPSNILIDTLVIHSMYHPQDLQNCFCAKSCKLWLDHCGVSAHYLIDREGAIWQTVHPEKMAWHAGQSKMPLEQDQRERVNDFSIGVELLATETSGITEAQYSSLIYLIEFLNRLYPLKNIVGHDHIAPDRKTDPWMFNWNHFLKLLDSRNVKLAHIKF